MSRSRNFQESRKCLDDVKSIRRRQRLLGAAAMTDFNKEPGHTVSAGRDTHSVHVVKHGTHIEIVFGPETVHARRVS